MTYNQVVDTFKGFASTHSQLNSFGIGSIEDMSNTTGFKGVEYPKLYLLEKPATYSFGEVTYSFDVVLVDVDHSESGNSTEIKSDMLMIWEDLLAHLYIDGSRGEGIDERYSISFNTSQQIIRETKDKVTGWMSEINIMQAKNYNACQIPTE